MGADGASVVPGDAVLPEDFDARFELVEQEEVTYVPLRCVVGECFVLACGRAEFHRQLRDKELPTGAGDGCVFFSRSMFSTRELLRAPGVDGAASEGSDGSAAGQAEEEGGGGSDSGGSRDERDVPAAAKKVSC